MRTLSLTQEGNTLKIALLSQEKGALRVECLKSILIREDVKPLYILDSVLGQTPYTVTTALDFWEVLFRKLHLPIAEKSKVLAALPFQLETLLPYTPEETIVAPLLKKAGKKATSVTLFTTKETFLKTHLEWAKGLELDPDVVTCTPLALYRLARWLFPKESNCALFYWGMSKSFCLVLSEGEIFLSQTLHFGLHNFLQALAQDFPDKAPEEWKNPHFFLEHQEQLVHFKRCQAEMRQELERLAVFLKNKQVSETEMRWLLLGDLYPGFELPKLWAESISSALLTVEEGLPVSPADLQQYALPIGIGLNTLAADDHSVQWRQEKWAPDHQLKKRKTLTLSYCLLCAVLACVMGLSSYSLLQKKEKLVAQKLSALLPPAWDKNVPSSVEAIRKTLWEWEKSLSSQQLSFPFLPHTPPVSEVLAWLSTHPVLTTSEGGKKEGIEIKSLHYQLYKYPKLGENRDPYQARVDLEFTATSPRLAREFHDVLLKGDVLVNAKREIKWSVQNNSYFTSFDLLPKHPENLAFAKVGASDFASAKQLMFLNMSDAADAKNGDADAGKNQIFRVFGYHPLTQGVGE